MKKTSIAVGLAALLVAGTSFALYESADAQHRKPSEPARTSKPPADTRTAPPSTPKEGRTAPPDAPKDGQAVPRAPDARREPPDQSRRRPQGPRGPEHVIVPYAGWPWWAYPPPYGYPPQPWRVYADWETANLRIDVSPNDAQVYVDRFYAGVVDDFDGIFQRLTLRSGPHLIEIRKAGYTSLAIEVNLQPGQTITYRRTMQPSGGGGEAPATASAAPGFDEGAAPPRVDALPGDVRFDVTPNDAAVYADGYYAGVVSDFSGRAQHLVLAPGPHHISLRADGYEPVEFDVNIQPRQTVDYRTTLRRSE